MLLDEKSSVKRKLDNLIQGIEQRKNKYSIISATLGSAERSSNRSGDDDGDDDGDEDRTSFKISEHRIRLTREKLELQEMGDKLDERVQKMETEIRAMENTLHVLNASNSCYKSSLSSVNPASRLTRNLFWYCPSDLNANARVLQATNTKIRLLLKRRMKNSIVCGCKKRNRSKKLKMKSE